MRRRRLLALAAGALAAAACAPAATPTQPPAPAAAPKASGLPILDQSPPDLTAATTWWNSKPLRLADLKGKPALVVFWTYT